MALAQTLLQMQTAASQRAGMETLTSNTFVTLTECAGYLNYGLTQVYDQLIAARGQNYYRSVNNFNTVNQQQLYALPANFYQLISVDVYFGGGNTYPTISAKKYQEEERNMFSLLPGWTFGTPIFYELNGGNIRLIPVPTNATQIGLNYVPAYIPLVNPGDTFDGVSGWEEWAIWYAASVMLAKEESDASFAMARMADIGQRIAKLASDRDAGSSMRIRDVSFDGWGGTGFGFGNDSW